MAQYVFTMNRVGKIVPPKRQILKGITLSFFPGAKIGMLGINGSGKSTLLKIMAGVDKEFEGEAHAMPDLKIGYLPQEPLLPAEQTVRQAVEEGIGGVLRAKKRLDEVYAEYADENADFDALAAEQAQLEAEIAAAGSENTDLQLELAADALRLPPWDAVIGVLSGGEKPRVALCRLLLSKPDMLLLDEPTNHLDAESVEWLEQFLKRFSGTVVAITHERNYLHRLHARVFALLLRLQPALFLVQPVGVVALPGDALAAVQLQNPLGRVVQKVAVVGDRHHGARVALQKLLQPVHRLGVQVVGRLVEQQHVGFGQQQTAQRDPALFTAREHTDHGVPGRQAQRVGGQL